MYPTVYIHGMENFDQTNTRLKHTPVYSTVYEEQNTHGDNTRPCVGGTPEGIISAVYTVQLHARVMRPCITRGKDSYELIFKSLARFLRDIFDTSKEKLPYV